MLGGGNPVGGTNPAGIGQTLNYVGDRVFAYSGLVSIATDTVCLSFTTGNEIIVAKVQCFNAENDSTVIKWTTAFNNQIVSQYHSEGRGSADREHGVIVPLIISPFTKIEIRGANASSAKDGMALFTGRIL
jgi:hypothetical protein